MKYKKSWGNFWDVYSQVHKIFNFYLIFLLSKYIKKFFKIFMLFLLIAFLFHMNFFYLHYFCDNQTDGK